MNKDRVVSSPPLNLCYLLNHVHHTPQVGALSIRGPAGDVELGHLVGFLALDKELLLARPQCYLSYLLVEDTKCPDGESIENLLTYQVHCILTIGFLLPHSRPVLEAAFLYNDRKQAV